MIAMVEEGLVLGTTLLLPLCRDDPGLDLIVAADEVRILALLAVAYGKAVGRGVLSNIRCAVREWRHGEPCPSQIHLALGGLTRLADAESASSRLILADRQHRATRADQGLRARSCTA
jgi:hypothetical protein